MLTFERFRGINNVMPPHRIGSAELVDATNVDLGSSGELRRRSGYSEVLSSCHKNLHQAKGFMLATVDGGDLVRMNSDGSQRSVVSPALGPSRVWYCNLADGRTTFSNGLINGITDGGPATTWGVPVPAGVGSLTPVPGGLAPGELQYQLTHVRDGDGMESAPAYAPYSEVLSGGVLLTGLPLLAGHSTNVYLGGYLAGNTRTGMFTYAGRNDQLVLPCRTEHGMVAPRGTITALWRSRVLVAAGPVMYASNPNGWERFDMRRDFRQFSGDITMIQPVKGGVFVGTTDELAFLAGTEFDGLVYTRLLGDPVVLGSGVEVPGELILRGESPGEGVAMICIAGGGIVSGFGDGTVTRMTEGRYSAFPTEVAATFRQVAGVPQYIAIPQ